MDDFGNEICPIDYPDVEPMVMLWRYMYFNGAVYGPDVIGDPFISPLDNQL